MWPYAEYDLINIIQPPKTLSRHVVSAIHSSLRMHGWVEISFLAPTAATTAWKRWVNLSSSLKQRDGTTVCYADAESGVSEVKALLHDIGFGEVNASQKETTITSTHFDVDGLVTYTLVEGLGWSELDAQLAAFQLKHDFPQLSL